MKQSNVKVRKKYARRSNIALMASVVLMISSIILFITCYTTAVYVWVITSQWATVTFIMGWAYTILNNSNAIQTTTRREELIFLLIRFLIMLLVNALSFSYIHSMVDGFVCFNSIIIIGIIFLSLDKFELEIIFKAQ